MFIEKLIKFSYLQGVREVYKTLGKEKEYTKNGIKNIKTKDNRYLRLDNYSEMVARTTTMEIRNSATILQVQELGYDLVKMSQHHSSCPVCKKYKNRIYSISGKDKRFPKLDAAFNNGYAILHPNCRHTLQPYIPKFNNIEEDIKKSNRPFTEPDKNEKRIATYYKAKRSRRTS